MWAHGRRYITKMDLIQLRTEKGIHALTPGITGWAQINGRDDLPIPQKVDLDEYYLRNRSFLDGFENAVAYFFQRAHQQRNYALAAFSVR